MSPWFPPRELKHSISIKQIKEEKRKKNKPRGNKIKRGPDENVDRENHLKRFEDFSRLHILEGEKERERYAGDGIVYHARFVTVRFTRKAQHLS
jgi:hypothetical protein